LRVVNLMPKRTSGTLNGAAVRSAFVLRIRFALN
jgi:hypothetical protein